MLCQACHRFTGRRLLCDRCRRQMRVAADRVLAGGVRLVPAFEHVGPARSLVHHLKYRGLTGFADLAAEMLAPRLPRAPLVPVPRAWSRRLKYGVDPSHLLARRLARLLGVPLVEVFAAAPHVPRRAGGDHGGSVDSPSVKVLPDVPMIVVDDVVTTGATLSACIEAIGMDRVTCAAAANVVPEVSSLLRPQSPRTRRNQCTQS